MAMPEVKKTLASDLDIEMELDTSVVITVETVHHGQKYGMRLYVSHEVVERGGAKYLGGSMAQAVVQVSRAAGLLEKE